MTVIVKEQARVCGLSVYGCFKSVSTFSNVHAHKRNSVTYCFDPRDFLNDNSLCSMIQPKFSCDNSLLAKSHCDFSNNNSLLTKVRSIVYQ